MEGRVRIRVVVGALGIVGAVVLPSCRPPVTPSSGGITCSGTSGDLAVSPGVNQVEQSNDYTLLPPSSTASCDDRSGAGITAATIERLALRFPSISCYVTPGTSAEGSGAVRWSDGTMSDVALVATLEGAYDGTLGMTVTSGHFTGMVGSTTFTAQPTVGECFGAGITRESASIAAVTLSRP